MTTAEVAAQYGVPLPETCKELGIEFYDKSDYEELLDTPKTHFYWIKTKDEKEYSLDTSFTSEQYFAGYYPDKDKLECFAAPQMHEIVPLLPIEFISFRGDDNAFCFDNNRIRYTQNVKNGNIAQAYAEMYLKLKSQNLLCQP